MAKQLKIFFSAPSVSNPNQKSGYLKIRDILLNFGSITYDWLKDNEDFDPESLAQKTREAIQKADVLVAEISQPSTGVGLQIAYASSIKIPVITLIDENSTAKNSISNNIASDFLKQIKYNFDNLETSLTASIDDVSKHHFMKFNFISTIGINKYLDETSKNLGMSKSEYLRRLIKEAMSKGDKGR